MIKLITALLFTAMIGISYHAGASIIAYEPEIQIDGTGYVGCDVGVNCWTGSSQSNASFHIDDLIHAAGYAGTLDLRYKYNVTGSVPAFEEGLFKDNYTIGIGGSYNNMNTGGFIKWDGGTAITCGDCFLVIADGIHDPIWYAFNINAWTETGDINFRNFWIGDGEISNVAIYSGTDRNIPNVPVPPAIWLMMTGLIGLVAVGRRRKD